MSHAIEPISRTARAHDHIREYRRSFNFWSPLRTLSTNDSGIPLDVRCARDILPAAEHALALPARSYVAGALPFDADGVPRLRSYLKSDTVKRLSYYTEGGQDQDLPSSVVEQPSAAHYMHAVAQAVERIRAGELHKIVLSRSVLIGLSRPLALGRLLERLAAQNPGKYVFMCDVAEPEQEARTLLGASPELLISKRGSQIASHPLAGSLPRSADSAEDRTRAQRLVQSEKNLREHAWVVETVADTLAPYCQELDVPRGPALVSTSTMWHLGTRITGKLRDPQQSSLGLALALHPTPAVGGVPVRAAREAIRKLEGFDRDYFAGAVGYCEASGDGEWAVTIRCAEVTDSAVRVYAGAGIVDASTPEDELAETSAKLRTMLRALGFERALEGA